MRHTMVSVESHSSNGRVERVIGSQVEIIGWYRRTPRPIVMIKKMHTLDGQTTFSSNRDIAGWILVALLFIGALVSIFAGFPNILPI